MSNAMYRFPKLYDVFGCCLLWTLVLFCLALTDHFQERTQEQQKTAVLRASYAALCKDLEVFPLAAAADGTESYSFENSWMDKRTFGGERGHEGCDIFGKENKRDYYPVVSMTAGRVEKVGWLTQGGNRIGIRSIHGGYFYYAHLSSYARAFHVGDSITAGQLLGFMGDTGYGAEGTTGMFMVHLHIGVYLRLPSGAELSVNPYWMLESLQEKKCRVADAYHYYSEDEYAIITANGDNMSCVLSPGRGATAAII